ncbi:hypothetical protein [Lacinutrix sp. Bg11-31]|uniref:hypothetical protein n=1 Tax=Lacinutrix sp. Bg11-31 TaxID=2057808 RepID=UPI000C3126CA|nr:hypothetical protein [Lacinutrix sp. Bg11-31]AUC81713.1 hypothetical protein CW733_06055 [Lacinutrix sp. Bg11-31]
MNKFLLSLLFVLSMFKINAQSCQEMIDFVTLDNYGTTYTNYDSKAISKVTFYNKQIEYQTYYFAIVCFKKEYSYSCNKYIYQVSSSTKLNYSLNYLDSAGKAFWKYIKPYNENLNCAPD